MRTILGSFGLLPEQTRRRQDRHGDQDHSDEVVDDGAGDREAADGDEDDQRDDGVRRREPELGEPSGSGCREEQILRDAIMTRRLDCGRAAWTLVLFTGSPPGVFRK